MTVTRVVTGGLERADVNGVGYSTAQGEVIVEHGTPPSAVDHANFRRLAEVSTNLLYNCLSFATFAVLISNFR